MRKMLANACVAIALAAIAVWIGMDQINRHNSKARQRDEEQRALLELQSKYGMAPVAPPQ